MSVDTAFLYAKLEDNIYMMMDSKDMTGNQFF
jgi:hypothetical protein